MRHIQPSTKLLKQLWQHISPLRRRQFRMLLILMLLGSFADILSIGAIFPFLAALIAPERVFENPLGQTVFRSLGVEAPKELLLPLTIIFGASILLAGIARLAVLWGSTRLSFAMGADLSMSIYRRTLYQPYSVHIARNSSKIISGISNKADEIIRNTIIPILSILSSAITLSMILITLLLVDPVVTLSTFAGFGLIYMLVIRLTRKRLLINSQYCADESSNVIKILQEGLGGIRDVLIDGTQATYCKIYRNSDLLLRRAQANSAFIGASPRFGIEALGMLLIAGLAYALAQQPGGTKEVIPVLGAFALGAQRLLPVAQQAYLAWSNIQSGRISLQETLNLLNQPLPDYAYLPPAKPIPFHNEIKLNNISFRYGEELPWVLKGIDLSLKKGSRTGFIGITGSGKSTLIDIIMGLLEPTDGNLKIDDCSIDSKTHRGWQTHIAHVPQAIFLADLSIQENIAFGVPKEQIDFKRVHEAARQAQIAETIESWPKKYETIVGERGIRLSGGQRQRIGIARALYKQADVIIFDEATSALDNETELAVMEAVDELSPDLTIIIIAHRLTTLKKCTQIVELSNGAIAQIGTYQKIISKEEIYVN